ncbi:glycogen synthase [Lacinutrix sp. Hel_I_90]|uniref:glycogen synthase n=1 Tax=Lacinutrix sp. Hel_I_90 TaxID=1249999 RepID=UPI0005CB780F|nr:glycogen/starch synthase [Lacinutrix sp. Hel_I_90]
MTIIHLSAECYPVAKVGGLADVVGALPKYQNDLGNTASVIMPFYNNKFTQSHTFSSVFNAELNLAGKKIPFEVLTLVENTLGFAIFFIHIEPLLYKDYVYSNTDTERFLAFQIAALDWLKSQDNKPDIIHCHDHHTGLIPFMLQESFEYKSLNNIPVVFTIHNAQYQGWFSHDLVHLIPKFNFDHVGLIDWNHQINPLAAAIKCAWQVTTVSPSYMEELKEKANGLEWLLAHEHEKCVGILNGIDTAVWNPETDEFIIKNYNSTSVSAGKKANKKWLCDTFDLDDKKPLFVFIGRLVGEKGADLFPEIFSEVLKNNAISILLLGSGETETEQALKDLSADYKNYNHFIGYDEKLSHILYAGADFLIMPSRVEPCGLNQLYALRYGTVAIVNNIGGLKDTITDLSNDGFGIIIPSATIEATVTGILRAKTFYTKKEAFKTTQKHIMAINHSWLQSAKTYQELYKNIS